MAVVRCWWLVMVSGDGWLLTVSGGSSWLWLVADASCSLVVVSTNSALCRTQGNSSPKGLNLVKFNSRAGS